MDHADADMRLAGVDIPLVASIFSATAFWA
jgi:hypothetical protein